jgi:putative aldouronate transport system substrate-binding protein
MKKLEKLIALLLVVAMTFSLAACGKKSGGETPTNAPTQAPATTTAPTKPADSGSENFDGSGTDITETIEADQLTFKEGTVLRMATGYNNAKTGISLDSETAGEGIVLADGVTYHAGDLKPTWVELQKRLGMVFEDKWTGAGSASKEFDYWKEQLDQVDMVAGAAGNLSEYGQSGYLVNIAEYLDMMPNFKAYLDANSIVRLSITGSTTGDNAGAIYFSPYFDGVDDIERMPLMRTDWVVKLLDGDGAFTASASGKTAAPVYEPYMPTSGKVTVDVVKADGSGVESVTKDYDAAGNIVANMNTAGSMSGVDAVNMLRNYIDTAYNGYYGTTRSNLFIGQNAAWDADELVALLRCVVANAQTLNGTDTIQGLFSREDANTQRRVDMFRFAGILFGVRGLESRQDCLYLGTDGMLHDARGEEDSYIAMERMNAMAKEGLISKSFLDQSDEKSSTMLENDLGFMSYDYNQTQTLMNETKLQDGEKYMAVMVPVARWFDGTDANGVYMRFTESWRSVKTDGWAISKAGVGDDQDKLYAALKLIDYAYSRDGMILMSYGPDAFIKTNSDGSYVTFNFNGTEMPVIADATYAELWEKAGGNYTNYARFYLGSTLSFVKSQAFEYQCTHAVGKEGAGNISTAIGLGLIKHPILAVTENPWYTSIPTVLPTTTVENEELKSLTDLTEGFGTAKDKVNYFCNIICAGYSGEGTSSRAEMINTVTKTWNNGLYLDNKQAAWDRLLAYYNATK